MAKHIIENDFLKVTVDDKGAELVSVYDKECGIERMWNADPKVWNRHSPLLFPFVGRVVDGVYRHEGVEYEMSTQHGFARDRELELVEANGEKIVHLLKADDESRKIYPFEFELYVTHRFSADSPREVEITWEVVNVDSKEIFYSIGGHPGFALDSRLDCAREEYFIRLQGKRKFEYVLVNPDTGFVVPDKKYKLRLEDRIMPITKNLFDNDALIFEEEQVTKVEILNPIQEPWVSVSIEGFPYVALWSKTVGDFICVEPWFGRTDDDGYDGELMDKPGEMRLGVSEKDEITYSIEFHK